MFLFWGPSVFVAIFRSSSLLLFIAWIIRYLLRECACARENISFREKIRENLSFCFAMREKTQIRCRGYDRQRFLLFLASSCLYRIAWETRDSKLPGGDWCRLCYYDTFETWHCSRLSRAQTQPSFSLNIARTFPCTNTHRTFMNEIQVLQGCRLRADCSVECSRTFARETFLNESVSSLSEYFCFGIFFLSNPQEQENTEILITS